MEKVKNYIEQCIERGLGNTATTKEYILAQSELSDIAFSMYNDNKLITYWCGCLNEVLNRLSNEITERDLNRAMSYVRDIEEIS